MPTQRGWILALIALLVKVREQLELRLVKVAWLEDIRASQALAYAMIAPWANIQVKMGHRIAVFV